jgi:hypothetical protein
MRVVFQINWVVIVKSYIEMQIKNNKNIYKLYPGKIQIDKIKLNNS